MCSAQYHGGFRAAYDASGNMTLRVEVSGTQRITYTQEYNAENRLAVVTNTVTGQVVRFVYDGDGNRVLRTDSSGTRVYIGDYYEKQGSVVTKYYYAGGERVALRAGGTLYFLHSDHLGSATVATGGGGNWVGEARYRPYGEMRRGYPVGLMPTDRLYTGQRQESLGLYDYRARYDHPGLGRFISADTIVPDPGNPQLLNRYAYGGNNPILHNDPEGHCGALCPLGVGIFLVGMALTLQSDVARIDRAPTPEGDFSGRVGTSLVLGDINDIAVLVTGRYYIWEEEVPYFSGEWLETGVWAVLPVGSRGIGRGIEGITDVRRRLGEIEEVGEEAGAFVRHHIATDKNWIRDPQWSKYFQDLCAKGGMTLEDAANVVELPAEFHKGPHSQAYHQWVYRELQKAIAGLEDKAKIQAALKARLQWIAEQLRAHPEYLRNPPTRGGR